MNAIDHRHSIFGSCSFLKPLESKCGERKINAINPLLGSGNGNSPLRCLLWSDWEGETERNDRDGSGKISQKHTFVCIASGFSLYLWNFWKYIFLGIPGHLCLAGFSLHARDGGGGVVLRGSASLPHSLLHRRPYHLQKHLHPCVHHLLARSDHDITWVVRK